MIPYFDSDMSIVDRATRNVGNNSTFNMRDKFNNRVSQNYQTL